MAALVDKYDVEDWVTTKDKHEYNRQRPLCLVAELACVWPLNFVCFALSLSCGFDGQPQQTFLCHRVCFVLFPARPGLAEERRASWCGLVCSGHKHTDSGWV